MISTIVFILLAALFSVWLAVSNKNDKGDNDDYYYW